MLMLHYAEPPLSSVRQTAKVKKSSKCDRRTCRCGGCC